MAKTPDIQLTTSEQQVAVMFASVFVPRSPGHQCQTSLEGFGKPKGSTP